MERSIERSRIGRRITSIKGISEVRRLPRLGKIYLGKKVKKSGGHPGCSCGPEEGCFKCTYPTETPYFVVPKEIADVYGEKPTILRVKVPVNNLEVVFPQSYQYYGSSRGLKCEGDLEIAHRLNENTFTMEEVTCNCAHKDKECRMTGVLNVMLYEVSKAGVYQIRTGSANSIKDINSGLDFVAASLGGSFAMVPLLLMRVPTITYHGGQKQTHHTLQIRLDLANPEMGKALQPMKMNFALPPADTIRPDLAGPVTSEEQWKEEGESQENQETQENGENSVISHIKNLFLKTERDGQGRRVKKWRLQTETGYYFTYDEAIAEVARNAMKSGSFVEIGFAVTNQRDANLIQFIQHVTDEKGAL